MIEVGEYVRSNLGSIGKVTKIEQSGIYKGLYDDKELITIDKNVVKHSEDIIDLIEVGDYVNGYYVEKVWEQVNYRMAIDLRGSYLGLSDDKFIKSIVTKEQFANIEYRLEENK